MKLKIDSKIMSNLISSAVVARQLQLEIEQLKIEKANTEEAARLEGNEYGGFELHPQSPRLKLWDHWLRAGFNIHIEKLNRYQAALAKLDHILKAVEDEYQIAFNDFATKLKNTNVQADAQALYQEAIKDDLVSYFKRKNFVKNIDTKLRELFDCPAKSTFIRELKYSLKASDTKAPSLFAVENNGIAALFKLGAPIGAAVLGGCMLFMSVFLVASSVILFPPTLLLIGAAGLVLITAASIKINKHYSAVKTIDERIARGERLSKSNIGGGSTSAIGMTAEEEVSMAEVKPEPVSAPTRSQPSASNSYPRQMRPAPRSSFNSSPFSIAGGFGGGRTW